MALRPRVSTKSWAFSMLLHCFVALTYRLFDSCPVPRAAVVTGFCAPTARNKRDLFESANLKEIFSWKNGSGRKSACASKQDGNHRRT